MLLTFTKLDSPQLTKSLTCFVRPRVCFFRYFYISVLRCIAYGRCHLCFRIWIQLFCCDFSLLMTITYFYCSHRVVWYSKSQPVGRLVYVTRKLILTIVVYLLCYPHPLPWKVLFPVLFYSLPDWSFPYQANLNKDDYVQ